MFNNFEGSLAVYHSIKYSDKDTFDKHPEENSIKNKTMGNWVQITKNGKYVGL